MLEKLKILLLESKYPFFDDNDLNLFLEENENNVYLTASILCYLKADVDKRIKIGPIEIEGPGIEFWINLSGKYSEKSKELANKNNVVSSSDVDCLRRG